MSAFAGLIVLIAGWPLNSIVTKRGIAIQRSVLSARDKRMGDLTELFGSVRAPGPDSCNARLIIRCTGEIYQILCLGGQVDKEGA